MRFWISQARQYGKEARMNWYKDYVRRVEEAPKREAEEKWDELCRLAGLPTDKEFLQKMLNRQHEGLLASMEEQVRRMQKEALEKPIDTEVLYGCNRGHVWVTGFRGRDVVGGAKKETWCSRCGKAKGDDSE